MMTHTINNTTIQTIKYITQGQSKYIQQGLKHILILHKTIKYDIINPKVDWVVG